MAKPVHILYMEDDEGLARLTQKRLSRAGYMVDLASNGAEGLAMYEAGQYDVVAVDHQMPEYDGLAVIRNLALRGNLPPTIMITGTGSERVAKEALKLGASDYIVKDLEGGYLELLPSVIEQVLKEKRLIEEKERMFDLLRQLNRNLTLLNLVGQRLAATLDIQQILELLLQSATEIIGAEASSAWLYNDVSESVVCQAAFHYHQHRSPVNLRLPAGEGLVGWVVQHGQSVIIFDVKDDDRFSPEIDAQLNFTTRSLLAVPLRTRDTVIGVLEVVNKINGNFDVDDQSLVETIASSAAIAIDNAQLVDTLRQHTKELQVRNEELDAFAHTVAHDLKSPLGPLLGLTEILESSYHTMTTDEIQQSLYYIRRSGRKMYNIIDSLLLLAQIRAADVQVEPIEMGAIVAEAQHRMEHMIEDYDARIIVPESWPASLGYGPWLEEVWVNYISNGMKYGGEPPRLELGAAKKSNGWVHFWVKDNGNGLTQEEQKQLFIPFTQLRNISTQGHGLGLSIVQRIVNKLGGQVAVESAGEGQGCTFSFTLPCEGKS